MLLIDYALITGVGVLLYELTDKYISDAIINHSRSGDETLTVGYSGILKKPITVDMKIDSHILIVGNSNSGKSKLAEGMFQNKNVVILNAFPEDFPTLKGKRIDHKDVLNYLDHVLDERTSDSEPLFLLIDELVKLVRNKAISKAIQELLCIARHYRVYLCCLSQEAVKEVISFKNLFNVRLCMKVIEDSTFRTVLGASVLDTNLQQREFYVRDNQGIRKGRSYDL